MAIMHRGARKRGTTLIQPPKGRPSAANKPKPVTGLGRRGLLLSPAKLREEKSRASAHRLAPHRRLSEDALAR